MSEPSPADLSPELRIPEREIELLYSIDWWDGPLSGFAKRADQHFWFEFYCDDGDGKYYFYRLHPIPTPEVDAALQWFTDYEGYERRYNALANDPSTRDLPSTKALADEWQAFEATRFDYASRPSTGWFCSGANPSFYAVQITTKDTS